ncbi:nucleoid-associated protein YgaU [Labrenzia sp. MBR-25]
MNLRCATAFAVLLLSSVFGAFSALAGEVEIVSAKATGSAGTWTFAVTLRHDDTGWDHYADLWQIFTPDGELLGERVLLHPHVDEQPFTRSLSGITIPEGVSQVIIRARDTVHGVSPQEYKLNLNR